MNKNKDEFVRLKSDYDPEKNVIIKYSKDFLTMIYNVMVKDKMMLSMMITTLMIYLVIALVIIIFK